MLGHSRTYSRFSIVKGYGSGVLDWSQHCLQVPWQHSKTFPSNETASGSADISADRITFQGFGADFDEQK